MFPPPVIEKFDNVLVVRDDLIPGGSKRRVVDYLLKGNHSRRRKLFETTRSKEFVYASPACGYAQLALAIACRELGLSITIFVAERKQLHIRTQETQEAGAKIVQVPNGMLTVVQHRARKYAVENNANLLPFGLDTQEVREGLKQVALTIPFVPKEVWTVAGSGTLSRSLQLAWPQARFYAVRVGCKRSSVGRADVFTAPERFDQDAKTRPPFPSCSNYDAKAWQFIVKHAKDDALFWNVAA